MIGLLDDYGTGEQYDDRFFEEGQPDPGQFPSDPAAAAQAVIQAAVSDEDRTAMTDQIDNVVNELAPITVLTHR